VSDGHPISTLAERLTPAPGVLPGLTELEKLLRPAPIPIHFEPVTTPLVRAGATFGYVITPALEPAPTAVNVLLRDGTLWFDPALLGAPLAGASGWAGVPFADARLSASGNVQFTGGEVVLDAAATLGLELSSAVHPATGVPGDPIGRDFLAATLTPFPRANVEFAPGGASIELVGEGLATVFGQQVRFSPRPGVAAGTTDLPVRCVTVPCDAAPGTFTVASSLSKELELSGAAPITGGAVAFPIVDAGPDALPQPVNA